MVEHGLRSVYVARLAKGMVGRSQNPESTAPWKARDNREEKHRT